MMVLRTLKEKFDEINKLYLFLLILIFILFLIFFINFSGISEENSKVFVCGDGTFYGDCSLNNPYYCDQGILVKNATSCGCPKFLFINGSECYASFYGERGERELKYVLNGVEGVIVFETYANFSNYLNLLPRSIFLQEDLIIRRDDFKFLKINDEFQREILLPLVVQIQNLESNSVENQAKIAISLVQNIPYKLPEKKKYMGTEIEISRFPYQVLEQNAGFCEDKSELLIFLLREIGYGTSIFHYFEENHEAVGIKCPIKHSINNSGYCFVESTSPVPITYSSGEYFGVPGGKLKSEPEIIVLSKGISLEENLVDYEDAKQLSRILNKNKINLFERKMLDLINERYGARY